jgi:hypothetical protein
MNRWKTAFWVYLIASILIIGFLVYGIFDQGVSFTYMRDGYTNTEADLQSLVNIVNKKNRSKDSIIQILRLEKPNGDTISLNRYELIFVSGQLDSIKQVW